MRALRFQAFLAELVDANLRPDVTRIEWADTGITGDPGMGEQTAGLVFEAPSGGVAYMQVVHGGGPRGDNLDEPERIEEGEPPATVEPVELTISGGRLGMADLESWLAALIINSASREVASVERYSVREADTHAGFRHKFGLTVKWHSGSATFAHVIYTLAPGERRAPGTEYRIEDAV